MKRKTPANAVVLAIQNSIRIIMEDRLNPYTDKMKKAWPKKYFERKFKVDENDSEVKLLQLAILLVFVTP